MACYKESVDFELWLQHRGFSDSSISSLFYEEFTSPQQLSGLDKNDIANLGFKLAQRKLLEKTVQELKMSTGADLAANTGLAANTDPAKDTELDKLLESIGYTSLKDILQTEDKRSDATTVYMYVG